MIIAAPALAQDKIRSLSHYDHTSWSLRQGAPPDVWALAQSNDGYLWLGTGAGLYRFDGIQFEKIALPRAEVQSGDVTALLALPSGDLWIGYMGGGATLLRDGRFTHYQQGFPSGATTQIVEDLDGVLWAGTYSGGLARFAGGRWREVGASMGFPRVPVYALAVTKDGTLWIAAASTSLGKFSNSRLMFLKRGASRFQSPKSGANSPRTFARTPEGKTWVSTDKGGLYPLETASRGLALPPLQRMVFDGSGSLWGTKRGMGVFYIRPQPSEDGRLGGPSLVEQFGRKDGLSSDIAASVLEDREGNIWIGTNQGLDRFRPAKIVPETAITDTSPEGYLAAVGPDRVLYISAGRQVYRLQPGKTLQPLFKVPAMLKTLIVGQDGAVWTGTEAGLQRYTQAGLRHITLPAGARNGEVLSSTEDLHGALWIVVKRRGLFRLDRSGWTAVPLPSALAGAGGAQVTADRVGGVWIVYEKGVVVWRRQDGAVRVFTAADGLNVGDIQILVPNDKGALIGGDIGLAYFDGHTMRSLGSERIPELERVTGIAQTDDGETWLNGIRGVVRVNTQALYRAVRGGGTPAYEVLDVRDGLPGPSQQNSNVSTLVEVPDRRLLLLTNQGIGWIDRSRIKGNTLAPPVVISAVIAGGKTYGAGARLPAGTSAIQINFTALSLANPERNQFRYRLDGIDKDWINPGSRREAFYTKLGPGPYRFHVIASNGDGVWNRTGAETQFTIAATFFQTPWFYGLCIALVSLFGWALYRLRIRYLADRIRSQIEARMMERERIARELHDTLLQSIQGLMLRFRAVSGRLPPDDVLRADMNTSLLRAEEALVEGRERVQDLRAPRAAPDLAAFFAQTAERLAPDQGVKVRVLSEGKTRQLHPLVAEELARIGEEALCNAFKHAQARMIEVGVDFGSRGLTLRIFDDGKGIAPEILETQEREGHFGVRGMRERAEHVGGAFTLASGRGVGTEVTVTVPANLAYIGRALFRRSSALDGVLELGNG